MEHHDRQRPQKTIPPAPGMPSAQGEARGGQEPLSHLALLRKHSALLATLILFLAGAYALYRLLAPLDMKAVLAQIAATPGPTLLAAGAATAVSYAALIGYDWSAMRYLGRRVPLPGVALGGFLGYAFGNTIGLSVLSGGAVRYRIYRALGLDAYDVAAVSSFVALSYGFGATLLGLGALAWQPAALAPVTDMAPALLRMGALGAALAIGGFLVWVSLRGGRLRAGQFSMHAPSLPDMGRAAVFTAVDVFAAALVLHLLLPEGSLSFVNLVAVFSVATMAGVASHVPGGIGVFESIMLAAMPASVPINDAVSALLLYRLIYFLLPFLLALAILSISEIWTVSGRRLPAVSGLAPVLTAGRGLIPVATGALVLSSGLFMMFAGLLPNPHATAEELSGVLPLAMVEGGPMISSIVGSMLVVLAPSVFRRARLAFWIVLAGLVLSIVVAASMTRDIERVVILSVMTLILLPCRHEFHRRVRLGQGVWSARWAALIVSILVSLFLVWYLVHQSGAVPSSVMWWQLLDDRPSAAAWRGALTAAVMLSAALVFSALRTARATAQRPDPEAMARARAIVDAHGTAQDMLLLTGDKTLMFGPEGRSVISYGVRGASWIALGAPAGEPEDCIDLAWAFADAARAAGARPVFYEAPSRFSDQAIEMGLSLHKMGEEAIVSLDDFSLDGPSRKRLRTSYNRALRDGLSLEIAAPPHSAQTLARLREISDEWLAGRAAREKNFSIGAFAPAYLQRTRIALVRHEGRIVAFATLLEAAGTRSAAVDLMRHCGEGPGAVMEYLFTALMLELSREGCAEFSLGMVPFAGITVRRGAGLWTRFGALVYAHGDRFYNFDGLRRFKEKFDPVWKPRYLCCRTALPPVGPLADAARLISGSAQGLIGK
ncbi:bifunctional lysylphosphatidylglycerol flippase/synthetase MprF [Profundibacterium mesophilum]|uniref:bifunctional lysylphosphatidylglycerol flippase/synthetase MprF n=1 Tax=Profundibacterium mesophilum TaxID=1258573 RepID=UPI00135B9D8B|nr:bifunctional lysylphosphatidylglycerol flippase/synthetase MprF [Profundibacterium mesophilum]